MSCDLLHVRPSWLFLPYLLNTGCVTLALSLRPKLAGFFCSTSSTNKPNLDSFICSRISPALRSLHLGYPATQDMDKHIRHQSTLDDGTILRQIVYESVLADNVDGSPTIFNNSHLPQDRLPRPVPEPSEAPYSFGRWLPLIQRLRHSRPNIVGVMTEIQARVVKLKPAQVILLVQASNASILTGQLNRSLAEDLQEEVYPAFSTLRFPYEGLFMRLDACSPKDGKTTVPGQRSVHSVEDVVLMLTTSNRACNAMLRDIVAGTPEISIFFLPFDKKMDTKREYRVFCAPGSCRITAISQYSWHQPWLLSTRPNIMRNAAKDITKGAGLIRSMIVDHLDEETPQDKLLIEQGFTFDVAYDDGRRKLELVELNVFGARSGCGSCLFNWAEDFDLLYGERKAVEFRVTF